MKVLIGTKNSGKIKKYTAMLDKLDIEYLTLNDIKLEIEIEENGSTNEENAILKAKAYYDALKMPIIVDDSGLYLDKLEKEKQPGIFVRRHNGKTLTDEEIIKLYSDEISKLGGETTGYFNIAIAIVDKNGNVHTKVTKHERLFVSEPCMERTKGYPMNSLIYDRNTNTYLAQNYEKEKIYEGNSFEEELSFIESVLKGE